MIPRIDKDSPSQIGSPKSSGAPKEPNTPGSPQVNLGARTKVAVTDTTNFDGLTAYLCEKIKVQRLDSKYRHF